MRIAIKIAYNGRKYFGFARQPALITVEGIILKILIEKEYIENSNKSYFRCASRTDKYVSAFGNVISFNTKKSITNILDDINEDPEDILFYAVKKVKEDFYPRYAKYRIYSYYLPKKDFDMEEIICAASIFIGEHNFSNFARVEIEKNPVRTIENIVINADDKIIQISFIAQTFLWNQIRRITSSIVKLSNNEIKKKEIQSALKESNKNFDFGISPPEPLILRDVIYDFDFDLDTRWLEKMKDLQNRITNFKYLSY